MKKRITIYESHGHIHFEYEEGIPFPSDWKWLSKLLTDWTTKASWYQNGSGSDIELKQRYGNDLDIRRI